MKKINKNVVFITLLSFIIAVVIFPFLPDMIPMHWGLDGEIDQYADKLFIFLLPIIFLFEAILIHVIPFIDPKGSNYKKFSKSYDQVMTTISLFLFAFFLATIFAAFYPKRVNISFIACMGIGILFTVIGNLMPKFRHNYFCGIRTPWTLASETVWMKTHRMAGRLWFLCGILLMLVSFLPPHILIVVILGDALVISMLPAVYSYIVFNKYKKANYINIKCFL